MSKGHNEYWLAQSCNSWGKCRIQESDRNLGFMLFEFIKLKNSFKELFQEIISWNELSSNYLWTISLAIYTLIYKWKKFGDGMLEFLIICPVLKIQTESSKY